MCRWQCFFADLSTTKRQACPMKASHPVPAGKTSLATECAPLVAQPSPTSPWSRFDPRRTKRVPVMNTNAMNMKVRRPALNFAETPAHWAANSEFAQNFNASSLWIPHLERFHNRVMTKAVSKMDSSDPSMQRLISEVRIVIRQVTVAVVTEASRGWGRKSP